MPEIRNALHYPVARTAHEYIIVHKIKTALYK